MLQPKLRTIVKYVQSQPKIVELTYSGNPLGSGASLRSPQENTTGSPDGP